MLVQSCESLASYEQRSDPDILPSIYKPKSNLITATKRWFRSKLRGGSERKKSFRHSTHLPFEGHSNLELIRQASVPENYSTTLQRRAARKNKESIFAELRRRSYNDSHRCSLYSIPEAQPLDDNVFSTMAYPTYVPPVMDSHKQAFIYDSSLNKAGRSAMALPSGASLTLPRKLRNNDSPPYVNYPVNSSSKSDLKSVKSFKHSFHRHESPLSSPSSAYSDQQVFFSSQFPQNDVVRMSSANCMTPSRRRLVGGGYHRESQEYVMSSEERLSIASSFSDENDSAFAITSDENPVCNSTPEEFMVMQDYTALKDDEISVCKGDFVQLIDKSKSNDRCMVYKPASTNVPAAEGYVPSFTINVHTNHSSSNNFLHSNSMTESRESILSEHSKETPKRSSWHSTFRLRKWSKSADKRDSLPASMERQSSLEAMGRMGYGTLKKSSSKNSNNKLTLASNSDASESNGMNLPKEKSFCLPPNFIKVPKDQVIAVGENCRFSCQVAGVPTPRVSWIRPSGEAIKPSQRYTLEITSDGNAILEIVSCRREDSGPYRCLIVNNLAALYFTTYLLVKGRPMEPGKPEVKKKTRTSILLKWSPPSHSGNSPVTSYLIELSEKGSNFWTQIVSSSSDCQYLIEDLTPGITYHFRVSARNEIGSSLPSDSSDFVTISAELNRISRSSEDFCKVSWGSNFDGHYHKYEEKGRGRFAVVKHCKSKKNNREVAAKVCNKQLLSKDDVENEVGILGSLHHDHIVQVIQAYSTQASYVIILEYFPLGRLFDFLVSHFSAKYTESIASQFMCQLFSAVNYIHSYNIAHLDIKPENLLVDGNPENGYKLKLIDFGDSIHLCNKNFVAPVYGSLEFLSPEIICKNPASENCDLWSLGVVMYVLLCGLSPFLDESDEETCRHIVEGDYCFPPEHFDAISQSAIKLISSLLQLAPENRKSAKSCLESPWFQDAQHYSCHIIDVSRIQSFVERRNHYLTETKPLKSEISQTYQTVLKDNLSRR